MTTDQIGLFDYSSGPTFPVSKLATAFKDDEEEYLAPANTFTKPRVVSSPYDLSSVVTKAINVTDVVSAGEGYFRWLLLEGESIGLGEGEG